jgi:hypothetical protein
MNPVALKQAVKQRMPWVIPIYSCLCWNLVIRPRWRRMGMAVFTEHYRRNGWGSPESVSGEGSTLEQTAAIRAALPRLVEDLRIKTMLDIPCGDFNWMRLLDLPLQYTGADIVAEIVRENQRRFASDTRQFKVLDVVADRLPSADLIFCRDCFFHFSYEHIFKAISNIKRSGAKYLLTTTNTRLAKNRNIVTGEWRRLNLQVLPFSLPLPMVLIDECCPNSVGSDKHMGLWSVSDL